MAPTTFTHKFVPPEAKTITPETRILHAHTVGAFMPTWFICVPGGQITFKLLSSWPSPALIKWRHTDILLVQANPDGATTARRGTHVSLAFQQHCQVHIRYFAHSSYKD